MLPVPYAFSKTGVLLGVLVMLVVAGSNCLTSLLLLRAAGKTGRNSYEGVALAVGGQKWKVPSIPASVPHSLRHSLPHTLPHTLLCDLTLLPNMVNHPHSKCSSMSNLSQLLVRHIPSVVTW